MKTVVFPIILAAMLCSTLGCTTACINTKMKSWEGGHKSELIRSWGLPTESRSDGLGGEVYVYNWSSSYTTPGEWKTTIGPRRYGRKTAFSRTYYPGQTFTVKKYRAFWIDADGYIYAWKWKDRKE